MEKKVLTKSEKIYNQYKSKESLLTNYQMVKAYFNDNGASILSLVERILKQKYNLPWQEKLIHKAVIGVRGVKNPTISIPQFKFEETPNDILSKFVKRRFDNMLSDRKRNNNYPFMFRDIVEKYS